MRTRGGVKLIKPVVSDIFAAGFLLKGVKMIRLINIFLVMLCSTSTVYAGSLSKKPFFSQYIHQTLTLQRPMDLSEYVIIKNDEWLPIYNDPAGMHDKLLSHYKLNDGSVAVKEEGQTKYLTPLNTVSSRHYAIWEEGQGKTSTCYTSNLCGNSQLNVWHLNSGDSLVIKEIVKHGGDSNSVVIEGEVYVNEMGKTVSFSYVWGSSGHLNRAPWEGEDIPLKRKVNY